VRWRIPPEISEGRFRRCSHRFTIRKKRSVRARLSREGISSLNTASTAWHTLSSTVSQGSSE